MRTTRRTGIKQHMLSAPQHHASEQVPHAAAVVMRGPAGATGPTGSRGPTGVTGPRGDTGPRGAAGADTSGARGAVGVRGATGARGATGPYPTSEYLRPSVVVQFDGNAALAYATVPNVTFEPLGDDVRGTFRFPPGTFGINVGALHASVDWYVNVYAGIDASQSLQEFVTAYLVGVDGSGSVEIALTPSANAFYRVVVLPEILA